MRRRSGGVEITVIRPALRDRFGDRGAESSHTLDNVWIDWEGTSDDVAGQRDTAISDVEIHCLPGSAPWPPDIRPGDRVVLPDGDEYFVVGKPGLWQGRRRSSPTGLAVELKART